MHLSLQDGWTALKMASRAGHMECVKVLLDSGCRGQHTGQGEWCHYTLCTCNVACTKSPK